MVHHQNNIYWNLKAVRELSDYENHLLATGIGYHSDFKNSDAGGNNLIFHYLLSSCFPNLVCDDFFSSFGYGEISPDSESIFRDTVGEIKENLRFIDFYQKNSCINDL